MIDFLFETDIEKYLPDWYKRVADYNAIMSAESGQMRIAESLTKEVYGNFYFSSMDEAGLAEWENIFGIIYSPGETVEFRRDRIINRLSMRPPFTLQFLKEQLDKLIGEGNYAIVVDAANYTIYVESSAESQAYATEAAFTINHIKPAHIVYINTPLITEGMDVSEAISKSNPTYHYRLGSWGLGIFPFVSESPEEVIKLASTPSIEDLLLEDLAQDVSGHVASVRINGTISITTLTKTVSDNVLTITYNVLPTDTNAVTSVELLDSNGDPLTSTTVYIPIPDVTAMKHTFLVKEGV